MPLVEVSRVIRGPRAAVYELVRNMERFPEFMDDVLSVKVLEREGNATITEWVTQLEGRRLRWKERDEFDDANYRIRYRQTEGDLKKFEGEWILEAVPEGTRVTLTIDFELGIPMFAALLEPIAKVKLRQNVEAMLAAIQQQVESGDA
ncbi:MAG TPA: aromatase/cyclase [Bacillota bacterium]